MLLLFIVSACATYYTRNLQFNQAFQQGRFQEAEKILTKDKKADRRKTKLLYFLNRGVVAALDGRYEQSNQYFEEAYRISDSYHRDPAQLALALLTNPNAEQYNGEDFERILLHYYKALNYLNLGNYESALVECRRMDIKLKALEDKYHSKNKYRKDAFIHLLMGLVYDVNHDYNNAFIAYRNAYNIYKEEYQTLFSISPPEQLKKDLLRTAYLTGFMDEVRYYEKEFGMKYTHEKKQGGELVFLWHNGLGPVKAEWSINFTIIKGAGGVFTFVNDELALNFSFSLPPDNSNAQGLEKLQFIRVAFPKYVERPPVYREGKIVLNNETYPLYKVEDINQIAFQSLKDRMMLELGTSLLRLALKKASEYALRQQNQGAGAALSAFNAITEKADTRNWQTLPHSIYYARIPVGPGEKKLSVQFSGNDTLTKEMTYNIPSGQTYFQVFNTFDSY